MSFLSNIQHLLNGVDIDCILREIKFLKKELASAKNELSIYSTSQTNKDREIESLKRHNKSLSDDLGRERNKLSIQEEKIGAFYQTIIELKKEIELLSSSEQKLKDEYKRATKKNASLNGKNLVLSNRVKVLEEQTSLLESLQLELSKKKTEIREIKAYCGDLQSNYDRIQDLLDKANKTIAIENSNNKALSDKYTALQESRKTLLEQIGTLKNKIGNTTNEYDDLKAEELGCIIQKNTDFEENRSIVEKEAESHKENVLLPQQGKSSYSENEKHPPYIHLIEANMNQEALEEQNDLMVDIQSAIQMAESQDKQLFEKEEELLTHQEEEEVSKEAEKKTNIKAEEYNVEDEAKNTFEITDDIINGDNVLEDNPLPYIYDASLIPADKLSIPEVYDVKEEKIINSRDFFAQNESELILWRRNLQEEFLMGHARFICPECKQPVKISGHKLFRGRVCYFAHFKDSDDCPYKTGTNRTKKEIEIQKYSLVQESERHKRLKVAIASALQDEQSKMIGVENVECEKRINSTIPYLNWRRPDIYAEYNGRKYVFELQLSTTFVSVIVDRDIFYRLNGYNIIWIFNFEDNKEYMNLHNLMCKDIYYANKRNVFIFDTDAEKQSIERGQLVLKCRWLDENGIWSGDKYITLDKFQYDDENSKPFIVDADEAYLNKYPEYAERRKQLENSREYLLKNLMERQKYKEELEKMKAEERSNLQLELFNDDNCVERFRSGTKYGYKYEKTIILPAKYTSAENIREDGYAQVGFNKKIGLVRKDGKEIVPVEYKNIDIINNQHGIVMASYKRIDLWLGNEHFSLINEYDDKEQKIIKEVENKKTIFILQSNTYNYSYTHSYYGYYPIRHKNWNGYSQTTLFSIIEENDFCVILITDKVYLLSKNLLLGINEKFSDIKSIGINQIFIAQKYETSLWGVLDWQGNIITGFKYAELIPTESEYLIVKNTNDSTTYGLIDYQGREFIESKYEALISLNSERFAFRKGHLWGICDRMGNVLHEAEYTYIRVMYPERLMASTLNSYSTKWNVNDCIPSYSEENVKLCLLNEKGDIVYTEQDMGQYRIRHSGDMYSILSLENKEIVSFCLSHIEFINMETAIIKDPEGGAGFFVDEKCTFFNGCKNIELLNENLFKFEDIYGNIALGNSSDSVCDYSYCDIRKIGDVLIIKARQNKKYALYSTTGEQITSHKFSSITFETTNRYAVIENKIKGYIDSKGNYIETSTVPIMENEAIIFVIMEKYGLKNSDGESIIPAKYSSIVYLDRRLLAVKLNTAVALFNIEGKQLTKFKYSNIYCGEDGSIQAARNNTIGTLDDDGQEIADEKHFYGGCLKYSFGEYFVTNNTDNVIIPTGYSKIEILDNDGILALWDKEKIAIWTPKNKTNPIYGSISAIGEGFFVVSKIISKKTRIRHIGYGYKWNICKEKRYGIIDKTLRTIIPCKYSSISGFDDEQNIIITNPQNEKKQISLQNLKKKASRIIELSINTVYDAKVQSFMPIGLIVNIQRCSFIIHKKYLFKEKKDFKKGEDFIAKYLGNGQYGHPIWETKSNQSENLSQ